LGITGVKPHVFVRSAVVHPQAPAKVQAPLGAFSADIKSAQLVNTWSGPFLRALVDGHLSR
jgi:hypothetical protein